MTAETDDGPARCPVAVRLRQCTFFITAETARQLRDELSRALVTLDRMRETRNPQIVKETT
jgi:hypothetical protein